MGWQGMYRAYRHPKQTIVCMAGGGSATSSLHRLESTTPHCLCQCSKSRMGRARVGSASWLYHCTAVKHTRNQSLEVATHLKEMVSGSAEGPQPQMKNASTLALIGDAVAALSSPGATYPQAAHSTIERRGRGNMCGHKHARAAAMPLMSARVHATHDRTETQQFCASAALMVPKGVLASCQRAVHTCCTAYGFHKGCCNRDVDISSSCA